MNEVDKPSRASRLPLYTSVAVGDGDLGGVSAL